MTDKTNGLDRGALESSREDASTEASADAEPAATGEAVGDGEGEGAEGDASRMADGEVSGEPERDDDGVGTQDEGEVSEDTEGGDNGAATQDGGGAQDRTTELADLVIELQSELDQCNDRNLRLAAEFQNYRKRSEAQRMESWTHAQADLVGHFLDVLDDLQRVSGLDPEEETVSVQAIVEGVDLVERKFLRALEDAGVEILDPAAADFDPATMEAMMRVSTDDPELDDTVQGVYQKGYALKGRLIRPARVSVFKHE